MSAATETEIIQGFEIYSRQGADLGFYPGETEKESYEAMARDAGYSSTEAMEAVTGGSVDEHEFVPRRAVQFQGEPRPVLATIASHGYPKGDSHRDERILLFWAPEEANDPAGDIYCLLPDGSIEPGNAACDEEDAADTIQSAWGSWDLEWEADN